MPVSSHIAFNLTGLSDAMDAGPNPPPPGTFGDLASLNYGYFASPSSVSMALYTPSNPTTPSGLLPGHLPGVSLDVSLESHTHPTPEAMDLDNGYRAHDEGTDDDDDNTSVFSNDTAVPLTTAGPHGGEAGGRLTEETNEPARVAQSHDNVLEITGVRLGSDPGFEASAAGEDGEPIEIAEADFYASDSDESTGSVVPVTPSTFEQGVAMSLRDELLRKPHPEDLGRGLRNAARRGDVRAISDFLGRGADIKSESPYGMTAFHIAVYRGRFEAVQALLQAGSNPCSRVTGDVDVAVVSTAIYQPGTQKIITLEDPKPLYLAAVKKHAALVKLLQARCTCGNDNVLFWALEEQFKDVVDFLVQEAVGIDQLSRHIPSHLEAAALSGNETLLRRLLPAEDLRSDVKLFAKAFRNAIRSGSLSCVRLLHRHLRLSLAGKHSHMAHLHDAALEGDRAMLGLLLDLGADADLKNGANGLPLHSAVSRGDIDCARLLLQNTKAANEVDRYGKSPLNIAVQYRHRDMVDLLLSYGASPAVIDHDGYTPIHTAVASEVPDILVKLLSHGGPINRRNYYGRTALTLAVQKRDLPSAAALLRARVSDSFRSADPDVQDFHGKSALHLATEVQWSAGLGLLLQAGADVNAVDDRLETPTHLSARRGDCDSLEILLGHEANASARNRLGETPLHSLIECNNLTGESAARAIRLLVDAGCDPDSGRIHGLTPLHDAVTRGRDITARELLRRGCNPNPRSSNGETPLHFAVCRQSMPLVELLLSHGASPAICDGEDRSPMYLAISPHDEHLPVVDAARRCDMLRMLLSKAPLSEMLRVTADGKRLLDIAAEGRLWDAAALIICHNGMFPTAQQELLHTAAARWDERAVDELLRRDFLITINDVAYIGALYTFFTEAPWELVARSLILSRLALICLEKGLLRLDGSGMLWHSAPLREWLDPHLLSNAHTASPRPDSLHPPPHNRAEQAGTVLSRGG